MSRSQLQGKMKSAWSLIGVGWDVKKWEWREVRELRRVAKAVGGSNGQSTLLTADKDEYPWVVAQSGCLPQATLSRADRK